MEIDIMNELLTATVMGLFGGKDSPLAEVKTKPKPVAIKAVGQTRPRSVEDWVTHHAPLRLSSSQQSLGLKSSDKNIEKMGFAQLSEQKRRVKDELKKYDSQFKGLFDRLPNRAQKEPLRPLYLYYKRLKNNLSTRSEATKADQIQEVIRKLEQRKGELKKLIEEYQKEFERNNNRKIMYLRDITPIEVQYKEYKEIKARIIQQEELLKKLGQA